MDVCGEAVEHPALMIGEENENSINLTLLNDTFNKV